MIIYFEENDFLIVFETVKRFSNEPSAHYESEPGLAQYKGVCEQTKMTYYPRLLDKASFLFVSIAAKQMFSNGNKRLAVATLSHFMNLNGYRLKNRPIKEFWDDIETRLDIKLEEKSQHLFFYTLARIVADSNINKQMSFEKRKGLIKQILKICFEKL